jgi:ABC-type Mn2+/Zn2+ transport system permease subunit
VVSLDAVGALLVAVVLVVPAATVRLVAGDVRTLQLGTVALAGAEGMTALLIADALDIGPGPVMAVLGGTVYAGVAALRR